MSVARVTEIIARSDKRFDDALSQGIARANKTLQGVTGAWIQDQSVTWGIPQDTTTGVRSHDVGLGCTGLGIGIILAIARVKEQFDEHCTATGTYRARKPRCRRAATPGR